MNPDKTYNILAIDDAKDTLMLLEFDLAQEGYHVLTADSGELAFDILAEQPVDFILLDMYMPGISGLAVLQKLKDNEEYSKIPVIMLSASDDENQIVAALELGADDYVTKPYIAKVLLARIRNSLRLLDKTLMLEALARTDFLTKINNRGHFECLTGIAISQAKRTDLPLVVAMLDIDFFKAVNDNYGHDAGDLVLVKFSREMKKCFRDYDILGRIGGEEFAVCMPHTTIENAIFACERFRSSIENSRVDLNESNESIAITVSIGLSIGQGGDINCADLLKKSDLSLYQAKESGRNQIKVYEELEQGIENNQLIEKQVIVMKEMPDIQQKSSKQIDPIIKQKSAEQRKLIERAFPEINYHIGVSNVLGDDNLFAEILVMFHQYHHQDIEKIQQAITNKDQVTCKQVVHTLKGVACSIGAMQLFEYVKALDAAINIEGKECYLRLFEPVATELSKVLKSIEVKLGDKL